MPATFEAIMGSEVSRIEPRETFGMLHAKLKDRMATAIRTPNGAGRLASIAKVVRGGAYLGSVAIFCLVGKSSRSWRSNIEPKHLMKVFG